LLSVFLHPALATANTQVTSFYNAALGARLVQQTGEGALGQLSDLRENQRIILSEELMGVLGQLLFIHRHNLIEVERYFDLSLLRDTGSNEPLIFNGGINGGQVINFNALAPDLDAGAETVVRLKNKSTNPLILTFYSANNPADLPAPPAPQFTVTSGAVLEKVIGDFQLGTFPELNIHNGSGMNGSWEIEIDV